MKINSRSNFQNISLSDKSDWNPSSFFLESITFDWIGQTELIWVSDLAKSIKPSGFAPEAVPVIQIKSVDPYDGKISNANTKAENVFYDWAEDGLRVGDLLVGPFGAILLTSKMSDILFSSQFIALRCESELKARWLWAILNCSTGKAILREVFSVDFPIVLARNRNRTHTALLEVRIPIPAPMASEKHQILQIVLDSLDHNLIISRDARASWFKKVSLHLDQDWLFAMRVQESSHWLAHAELIQNVEKVIVGKLLKTELSEKVENSLPVVGLRFMKQQTSSALDYTGSDGILDLGLSGDILLCSSLNRLHIFDLTFTCALGRGVFAIRPKNPVVGLQLRRGLQSQVVQDQIAYFRSGSLTGMIRKSDVEKLRVPLEEVENTPVLANNQQLSNRLDAILWS